MAKEIINIENAPKAVGPYSQAVKAEIFLFISGQIPIDPTNGVSFMEMLRYKRVGFWIILKQLLNHKV